MFLGRVLGITTSVMPLACPIGLSFSSLLADGIGGKCLGQYQQRIDFVLCCIVPIDKKCVEYR